MDAMTSCKNTQLTVNNSTRSCLWSFVLLGCITYFRNILGPPVHRVKPPFIQYHGTPTRISPSEIEDPSIPVQDIKPQPPIAEKVESPYGNVLSSIVKTPVESHDDEEADDTDNHGYVKCIHATDAPVGTQQTHIHMDVTDI